MQAFQPGDIAFPGTQQIGHLFLCHTRFLRKAIIWRFISNVVESASYSALTAGSFNAVCLNVSNVGCLCAIALYLFQSFLYRFHMVLRDFVILLEGKVGRGLKFLSA